MIEKAFAAVAASADTAVQGAASSGIFGKMGTWMWEIIVHYTGLLIVAVLLLMARKWLRKPVKVGYRDVVRYFTENRPSDDSRIARGYVVRSQQHGKDYYTLKLAFVDANNKIVKDKHGKPYGKVYERAVLDNELQAVFDKNDVIRVNL